MSTKGQTVLVEGVKPYHELRDHAILVHYSEWLDADENILIAPEGDERTHDELVNEFIEYRNELFNERNA